MAPTPLPLDRPVAVDVRPGGEIIVSGSCYVSHDGSRIDAATTHWPKEAPGGESIDPVGLIDVSASGLTLVSRDLPNHKFTFTPSGGGSPVCKAVGIQGACLVPRSQKLAIDRGLRLDEFLRKVSAANECLSVEVPEPPALAPVASAFPYVGASAGVLGALTLGFVALRARGRRRSSPAGQLLALAKRVQNKVASGDAVLAAPLGRAVDTALRSLKAGRVDPASSEGKRVATVLARVEAQLDSHQAEARAEKEREAADELVREVESALEAAEEASAIGARTKA